MHSAYIIPVLSLVVQLASTLLAIGLIRRSGRRTIAVMLFVIILLMTFRRSISLVRSLSGPLPQIDLFGEIVALSISFLVLLAVIQISRLLSSEQASEEKFRTLFESANDGIFLLATDGRFIDVNLTAHERLGYTKKELLSMHISEIVSPRFSGEVARRIALTDIAGHSAFESEHVKKDGATIPVDINVRAVKYGGKRFFCSIVRDITAYKRVEEALRNKTVELDRYRLHLEEMVSQRTAELRATVESLEREIIERTAMEEDLKRNKLLLANILNSIQDPIMVLDKYQRMLLANKAFETSFSDNRSIAYLSETCYGIFYGRSRPCSSCLSNSTIGTGRLMNREISYGTDGAMRRWYDVSAFPLSTAEGRIIGSVHHMRDTTKRKQAEEEIEKHQDQLRSLAHQLLAAEEQERRKIAQELHDGLLQNLALCRMLIKTVQSGLSPDAGGMVQLLQVHDLLGHMMSGMRSLTYQLAPPILYELGLEPALEQLFSTLLQGNSIEWRLDNRRKMPPLQGDLAPVLYAMVRELIVNVLKHARAGQVDVTIDEDDGHISVEVRDDGGGFAPPPANATGGETAGFGLFSIRERLRHLGGSLEIGPSTDSGVRARIEIPVAFDASVRSIAV